MPALIIFAAVLIAYIPAMRGGFIWDDDMYVTQNVTLRDGAGLKRIWFEPGATPQYYPLVFTTFWVERQMWGVAQPAGYHVTNILLHAANALLLWLTLRRLKIPGAWLAAMLFAVHPVHVESVAWITERKNVLSGLFYLGAFLAYWRFSSSDDQSGRWRFYVLSLILFVAALSSKTVTCTLPAAIVLILWWKNQDFRWRDFAPLLPMFLLALPAAMVTAAMERQHVGAQGPEWAFSILDRTLIAGRAVWFYLFSILAPANLMFIYPRWRIDASEWWQFLFPVAALVAVILLWLCRERVGKGPLVAFLFFVGTLVPALGFVNVYPMQFSFVADHFQYLASIGPIALIAAAATLACSRWVCPARATLFATVLLVLMEAAWRQELIYKDSETLWNETLRRNPEAWIAHNNLSDPLLARGDFAGAAEHARLALLLRPNYAPAHNNLGLAMEGLQRNEEAVAQFREAISLEPSMPQARLNLAGQLVSQNDLDGAEREYLQAIKAAPEFADAHYNYAVLLAMRGRTTDALRECATACALNPDDPQSQLLLRTLSGHRDN
ncbi:MAG TPA: tetratricopeptide repeat protein [Chthoniobacterales bacterium]